jgi:hypothetical protein
VIERGTWLVLVEIVEYKLCRNRKCETDAVKWDALCEGTRCVKQVRLSGSLPAKLSLGELCEARHSCFTTAVRRFCPGLSSVGSNEALNLPIRQLTEKLSIAVSNWYACSQIGIVEQLKHHSNGLMWGIYRDCLFGQVCVSR